MPFSHHSHSGQFCPEHAKDQLEEVVKTAIAKNMVSFALTEHMPRHNEDRYPGEDWDTEFMFENQADYYREAVRLQEKYGHLIQMPIGFESDFCRPESEQLIQRTLSAHEFDFFIGSLHHVHSIPIDYDRSEYERARTVSGGTDERLFEDYFDEHLNMLQILKPPVVGHFDLIRLKSDNPDASFQTMTGVWQRILRNLKFIASYGGVVEINCASLRKGMQEPYPKSEICQEFVKLGGRFCLSDDSHGVDQVALNYHRVLPFLHAAHIATLHYLEHSPKAVDHPMDVRFPSTTIGELDLEALEQLGFWSTQGGQEMDSEARVS